MDEASGARCDGERGASGTGREGLTGREKESRFLDSELRRWNDGWRNARSVRSPN